MFLLLDGIFNNTEREYVFIWLYAYYVTYIVPYQVNVSILLYFQYKLALAMDIYNVFILLYFYSHCLKIKVIYIFICFVALTLLRTFQLSLMEEDLR